MNTVHIYLTHDPQRGTYLLTLTNPYTQQGWHVWDNEADTQYETEWTNFMYYFNMLLHEIDGGWSYVQEELEGYGEIIYQGSDPTEAKHKCNRIVEYL